VNRVFDDDTFRDEVGAIAAALAAKAPLARRGMKQHYVAAESMGFGDYIALETDDHRRIVTSDDCREAFRAFVEKRPAQFTGR
jgi:enoyl-CoA hydratase